MPTPISAGSNEAKNSVSAAVLRMAVNQVLFHRKKNTPPHLTEVLEIKKFLSGSYDLFNKEWLGLRVSDSVCAVACPFESNLKLAISYLKEQGLYE